MRNVLDCNSPVKYIKMSITIIIESGDESDDDESDYDDQSDDDY